MKKLVLGFAAVVFLSVTVFAQAAQKTEAKKEPLHYVYMGGKMSECMGAKGDPMTKDVTLKNGTMVSTKGEVTTKDGKKSQLKEGECIDPMGMVMPHDKAHAAKGDMKKDNKM